MGLTFLQEKDYYQYVTHAIIIGTLSLFCRYIFWVIKKFTNVAFKIEIKLFTFSQFCAHFARFGLFCKAILGLFT